MLHVVLFNSKWIKSPTNVNGNPWQYNFFRQYRHTAYRQLIGWCWQWLGKKVRVPLPSCAVARIRYSFPSETHALDSSFLNFRFRYSYFRFIQYNDNNHMYMYVLLFDWKSTAMAFNCLLFIRHYELCTKKRRNFTVTVVYSSLGWTVQSIKRQHTLYMYINK